MQCLDVLLCSACAVLWGTKPARPSACSPLLPALCILHAEPMARLEKLGISKYINNFSIQQAGFKVECTDFVVHEMHQDETCAEGPKLNIPAIVRAHAFLTELSTRPEFEVHDARIFRAISSEEDVLAMYNTLPPGDAECGQAQHAACGGSGSADTVSTRPTCDASLQHSAGPGSFCVGTYACQDKELRTAIHKALKPHPFVKTKTVANAVHFVFSRVNTYVFVVKKINRDTASVATSLGKKIGHVSFAGNKDKKAVTYQRMSATTDFMKLYGCDVMDIRRGSAVKMGELLGNRFVIRVRDLRVENVRELSFLNYFGNQRFGKGLNNHEIGKHILEGRVDEALELVVRTYSENYERDGGDGPTEECGADAETVHSLYQKGDYRAAYLRIPPRFGVERHIVACRMKNVDPRLILKSMRRESLMLYLHSYQSYLFNMSVNERIERGFESSAAARGGEGADYVLENGRFVAAACTRPEDVWLRLEKLPHSMCKGGFRKMVETANDFQAEVDGSDTVFRFWLRPCAFATMAIREFIGDSILP